MSGTAQRGYRVVSEETVQAPPAPIPDIQQNQVAARVLMVALHALGQRTVVAISNLFTAALVASVWFLWWSALANPTPMQLTGLGGYALFVLAIEIVRRRK